MATFPIGAKVGADTSSFIGAMGGATKSLQAFTGAASLAAGAIAAAAIVLGISVVAAREYQTELVKLNTLVGIQTEQIEAWDGALKDLAVETGRAPADLARAMFAITSGGARGTQAMELLEQAAKASALGLGDMTSLGRTATAMLQAFADEGLTAEKAIDVLLLTMRQGNLEAGSLAGAFSRVLGPAKALGSNVEEIGAFLATFTRLGGSTEEAATGLLNMFQLLIKPPKDAREAMEKYGISIDLVRQTLEEEGLPAALAVMKGAIGGSVDAMGEMIPSVRALIAFLNTAGLQSDSFAADLEIMRAGLGATNEAFLIWGGSADATFTQFTAAIKVAGVAIGELLLPPVTLLLKTITPLIGLLRLSAEGLEEIARIVAKFPIPEGLRDLISRITEDSEVAVETFAAMVKRFQDTGAAAVNNLRDATLTNLRLLNGEVERGIITSDQAREINETLGQTLSALSQALRNLAAEEAVESDEKERSIELTGDQVKALEAQQEEVRGIVEALQEEILLLEEGERAVLEKNLIDLEATGLTQLLTLALFDKVAALNAEADALKESEQASERAAKAEKRRLETIRKEKERGLETARRALERIEMARLNDEMREATQIAQQFADTIGTAFEEVIGQTKSVADAFADMVTDILKQLQRLVIQKAIVEPLLGAILNSFAPGSGGGSSSPIQAGGFNFSGLASIAVNSTASAVASGASATTAVQAGSKVVVQQTINFSPNLIDARSGQRFLQEQAGTIAQIIGDGVAQSGELANAVRNG